MLPGWWLSVWVILWVQVSWDCWFSFVVALLLSFFQLFPNSTTGVPSFCSLVGCKYLLLSQSTARWASQRVCYAPVCEHTRTSILVSGLGVSPWDGSQFGLVTGPPFPQCLLHFCPCSSFRLGQFWVSIWLWDDNSFSHLMPCPTLQVSSTGSLSPLLGISLRTKLWPASHLPLDVTGIWHCPKLSPFHL